jgi:hypothetical protein
MQPCSQRKWSYHSQIVKNTNVINNLLYEAFIAKFTEMFCTIILNLNAIETVLFLASAAETKMRGTNAFHGSTFF